MPSQAAKPPSPHPSPRLPGEEANMQSEAKRSNVAIEKRRTPAARQRWPVTGRVIMRKFAAAVLAGAALSFCVTGLAQAKGKVIGVSWSNFQEERWKTDEAAMKAAIAAAR